MLWLSGFRSNRGYLVSNLWRRTTVPWVILGFIPTLFFFSLDDSRSLLLSQGLSIHRKIERKALTFQTKTKPVRVAVKYC